ncbi:MAG: hypothetical protein Q7U89_03715 [Coriobacteriia bacterium]|nr:hypothetical protein [Coriobacteriia bacterium]
MTCAQSTSILAEEHERDLISDLLFAFSNVAERFIKVQGSGAQVPGEDLKAGGFREAHLDLTGEGAADSCALPFGLDYKSADQAHAVEHLATHRPDDVVVEGRDEHHPALHSIEYGSRGVRHRGQIGNAIELALRGESAAGELGDQRGVSKHTIRFH